MNLYTPGFGAQEFNGLFNQYKESQKPIPQGLTEKQFQDSYNLQEKNKNSFLTSLQDLYSGDAQGVETLGLYDKEYSEWEKSLPMKIRGLEGIDYKDFFQKNRGSKFDPAKLTSSFDEYINSLNLSKWGQMNSKPGNVYQKAFAGVN